MKAGTQFCVKCDGGRAYPVMDDPGNGQPCTFRLVCSDCGYGREVDPPGVDDARAAA
jgi:hypothetical protein